MKYKYIYVALCFKYKTNIYVLSRTFAEIRQMHFKENYYQGFRHDFTHFVLAYLYLHRALEPSMLSSLIAMVFSLCITPSNA